MDNEPQSGAMMVISTTASEMAFNLTPGCLAEPSPERTKCRRRAWWTAAMLPPPLKGGQRAKKRRRESPFFPTVAPLRRVAPCGRRLKRTVGTQTTWYPSPERRRHSNWLFDTVALADALTNWHQRQLSWAVLPSVFGTALRVLLILR